MKEEQKVWIRGSESNPEGVIKALENLGGENIYHYNGDDYGRLYFINKSSTIFYIHKTNTSAEWLMNSWKEIQPVIELKDKQLVWAWDNDDIYIKRVGFYDARNTTLFKSNGKRGGFTWNFYEPYIGEYPQWAKDALTKLED